jgi:L-cysteine:1D-myo-inositol 2-amino-2-deoxy-alpha-D-glucopyranoside ligase
MSTVARDRLGAAPPLEIFDRRAGRLVALDPVGSARLYVCGITPYDATHLGHAATYVAFDLMNRAWRASGLDVTYVQNVTDIDDPLLERAAATGEDWSALAERETQLFREDMTALSVIPPDHYIGAVEAIPLIVELIQRLRDNGAVYDVDGDLYFAVEDDPAFGEVSGLDRAAMLEVFPHRGGDPERPGKRDPLDCLLWQGKREGEPSWDTEVGPGRPGWHVECAAIAMHYLGRTFDVQGGGFDLAFPHHEMSAGEGHVAYPGEQYARLSVHAGMVGYDGHKMSKSLGNLVLVSALRAKGVDPRAIRLALLSQHYRSDWDWTPDLLEAGERRLEAWLDAVRQEAADPTKVVAEVRRAMAHDLDAPAALSAVDDWAAGRGDQGTEPGSGELVAAVIEESLGVSLR